MGVTSVYIWYITRPSLYELPKEVVEVLFREDLDCFL